MSVVLALLGNISRINHSNIRLNIISISHHLPLNNITAGMATEDYLITRFLSST